MTVQRKVNLRRAKVNCFQTLFQAMTDWKFGIVRHYDDEKGRGFVTEISYRDTADVQATYDRTVPCFLDDYFVAEQSIKQYMPTVHRHNKRLITGEYVQFQVDARHTPHGTQKQRVARVCGIFGGPLIFEQGDLRFEKYTRINQTMYPPRVASYDEGVNHEPANQSTGLMEGMEVVADVGRALEFVEET
jgi:hypothetical protein